MSLSLNDLKLLALTYEIELENNGQKNINQSVLSVINSVTTSKAIKNKTSPGINFLNSNTAKDSSSNDIKKKTIKDQILLDEKNMTDFSDLIPEDNLNNVTVTETKSNNSNVTQPDTTIFIEEEPISMPRTLPTGFLNRLDRKFAITLKIVYHMGYRYNYIYNSKYVEKYTEIILGYS